MFSRNTKTCLSTYDKLLITRVDQFVLFFILFSKAKQIIIRIKNVLFVEYEYEYRLMYKK